MLRFSTEINMNIESYIRVTPDFPKPGIIFRDFTPLLADGPAFKALIDQLSALFFYHFAVFIYIFRDIFLIKK